MTDFDAYVRHQVYVEGYKNGQSEDAETLYEEITAAIIIALNKLQITTMGELTKKALTQLVSVVTAKVKQLYGKQINLTVDQIRAFMNADINIVGKLLNKSTDKKTGYNTLNHDTLWSSIMNDPIPGVGLAPTATFTTEQTAAIASIVQLIRRAWADNVSLADLFKEIVGTRADGYKNGLMFKLRRRLVTAIETVIQHVTTSVQFKLGALTATHYVWCAILDNRTTEICRSRNGHTYEYGKGPRPPAHYRCRSFVIPATIVKVDDLPTFYTWVKRQPANVQDDVLGPARGRELRENKIKSDDLPGFDRTRPLTVSEYGDKLNKILSEVA